MTASNGQFLAGFKAPVSTVASAAARTIAAGGCVILCGAFLYGVTIYESALRDPRFLDGWVLAGGMALQLALHIAIKTGPALLIARLRKLHVITGCGLIAVFTSHMNFSLPDTAMEWMLATLFAAVTASGIAGTRLSRAPRYNDGTPATSDAIARRVAELRQQALTVTREAASEATAAGLPAPPHAGWIADLYANHLERYLASPGHALRFTARRPPARIVAEISGLMEYADAAGKERLNALNAIVLEKHRLGRAAARAQLASVWLLVHVPMTYALVTLAIIHVLAVYSYSSGAP